MEPLNKSFPNSGRSPLKCLRGPVTAAIESNHGTSWTKEGTLSFFASLSERVRLLCGINALCAVVVAVLQDVESVFCVVCGVLSPSLSPAGGFGASGSRRSRYRRRRLRLRPGEERLCQSRAVDT